MSATRPPAAPPAPPGERLHGLPVPPALLMGGAALLGLVDLLATGAVLGARNALLGALLALGPVPLYAALAFWVDRHEREPARFLALAFAWGATVAAFVSLVFNALTVQLVLGWLGPESADLLDAVVGAPLVEEVAKGFALFLLFAWASEEFDGVVDGIVYAAMVGLGFAMTENVLYYGLGAAEGLGSALDLLLARGVLAPFAHPLFTAMTGVGFGLAYESRSPRVQRLAPWLGLAAAVLLHALWNLADFVGDWERMYLGLGLPTFAGMLAVVVISLRREARAIARHLRPELRGGDLSRSELRAICTLRGHLRGLRRAWRCAGLSGWLCFERFRHTGSDLALHRARGARRGGASSADLAWEAECRGRLAGLRARVAALG